jgi:hypothetical protein
MSPGDRCDQIIRLIDEALAVETMGLEPTTPCLQSRIVTTASLGSGDESPGQCRFPLTATITQ